MINLISEELPYDVGSLARFSGLRPLGSGLFLDSGTGYPDHIDVLTAAPVDSICVESPEQLTPALDQLRERLRAASAPTSDEPVAPGWFGVWSYNLGEQLESVSMKPSPLPQLWMGFYPAIIVNNHLDKRTRLISLPGYEQVAAALKAAYSAQSDTAEDFTLTGDFNGNLHDEQYRERFERVQRYIHDGDCYQINLTREFAAPYSGSAWTAYCRLRSAQSAPMGAYLEVDDWALLSLSPERFLRAIEGKVEAKPIKGTRPRSDNPRTDLAHRDDLVSSSKDRAENLMIVDLLRNDLGRTCAPGSVKVDKLFDIESFSSVHHLVSTVSGQLATGLDALDLLLQAFPGGSITGAPKHRAMEIIEELEPHSRDFYCGSVVYLDVCGRMDSSILIRSLVAQNGQMRCWGGGGIVADSTCSAEYQEINDKIGKLLKTLQ